MASLASLHRPLGLLLVAALALQGCSAVRVNEHTYDGSGSAVSVRVVWDDHGISRLVGGIPVSLERLDGAGPQVIASGPTGGEVAWLAEGLAPGRYRVVLSGAVGRVEQTFRLGAGKRVSLRVQVEVEETSAAAPPGPGLAETVAEGTVFVLKAIGVTLAVVAVVGLLVLAVALDADDDEDEDCDRCHACEPRRCACSCH